MLLTLSDESLSLLLAKHKDFRIYLVLRDFIQLPLLKKALITEGIYLILCECNCFATAAGEGSAAGGHPCASSVLR